MTSSTAPTWVSSGSVCPASTSNWPGYPQLYSRIGFAHHYKPLDPEDIPRSSRTTGSKLGLPEDDLQPVGELVNAIVRITGGNFRLIERLMTQLGRLRDINDFHTITIDLITAARQTLVNGAPGPGCGRSFGTDIANS